MEWEPGRWSGGQVIAAWIGDLYVGSALECEGGWLACMAGEPTIVCGSLERAKQVLGESPRARQWRDAAQPKAARGG